METKKWWQSKTLWANAVALLASLIQEATGTDIIDAQGQIAILSVINMGLRAVTKTGLA